MTLTNGSPGRASSGLRCPTDSPRPKSGSQRRKDKLKAPVADMPGTGLCRTALLQRLRASTGHTSLMAQMPTAQLEASEEKAAVSPGQTPILPEHKEQTSHQTILHRIPGPPLPDPEDKQPSPRTQSMFARWTAALPRMIRPYQTYANRTFGKKYAFPGSELKSTCTAVKCKYRNHTLVAMNFAYYDEITITSCKCQDLLEVLIRNGLFPSAPSCPNVAISLELLGFYSALFDHASDAISAMAAGLHAHYLKRGYRLTDLVGQTLEDPLRRPLGFAFLWYGRLMVEVEKEQEVLAERAELHLDLFRRANERYLPTSHKSAFQVLRLLRQRCPACFGGTQFGRSFKEGGDIHVCVDGNFNHKHCKGVDDCPSFYDPEYIIPKEEVDAVGHRIDLERKRPKPVRPLIVPDAAIDGCQNSHTAGSGSNQKADMDRFDSGGLMALVCRHDIPLFAANIDTPGEQQKYAVALIEHLMALLPPNANVVVFYDVGCVLDRSLNKYDIIEEDVLNRLLFATSAMHAYAHQWACQVVFNPRYCLGMGLTDGEGVERLWSSMRKLIGITRTSAARKRIFTVDRRMKFIGQNIRGDLGSWINRKLADYIEPSEEDERKTLGKTDMKSEELRKEWASQKESQLSIRAHAPARFTKGIEDVLAIQEKLDEVQQDIQSIRDNPSKFNDPQIREDLIEELEYIELGLKSRIATLHGSLHLDEEFPRLASLDHEFLVKLLLARDLKIHIRKRVIESFFEWDRLDQAVGGRNPTIGTKAYQATRQAINRRNPHLTKSIHTYNGYCAQITERHNPTWNVHVPRPLSTELATMKNDINLMEDVWIDEFGGDLPRWLSDPKIRQGIQALLRLDRCSEERKRLELESHNLLRWFGKELAAVELALALPQNQEMEWSLQSRRIHLLNLKYSWVMPGFVSRQELEHEMRVSQALVQGYLSGISSPYSYPIPRCQETTAILLNRKASGARADREQLHSDHYEPVVFADWLTRFGSSETRLEVIDEAFENMAHQIKDGDEADGDSDVPEQFHVIWATPLNHREQPEDELFESLRTLLPKDSDSDLSDTATRILACSKGTFIFNEQTIGIMMNDRELLDDDCLNGLAHIMQYMLIPQQVVVNQAEGCALFKTFHLLLFRGQNTDQKEYQEHMWSHSRRLEYWNKSTWILPIHRRAGESGHWVLCTVSFENREIYLFDSLAERGPWQGDIIDVVSLISLLRKLAFEKGYAQEYPEDIHWVIRPTLVQIRQRGGIDCGLWVLAAIFATLCGYTGTGATQTCMSNLRKLLLRHIQALPRR